MICVAVTYRLKPGTEREALAFLERLTVATRMEPGCRMYLAHQSASDPLDLFLYEQYDDESALEAHRASPHFHEWALGGLFPLLESRRPSIYLPLEPSSSE
ncbi:MAG: putative quinol monooxygenase [Isosphaeraceae bacterium]|nr:putative quinol monooxygenase [Isosphaeraceae bacterium]